MFISFKTKNHFRDHRRQPRNPMDSISNHSPAAPPFFPWDHLPISIQETILSLLPISTLIVCKSVSRSLRSAVQSPAFTSLYPHQRRRRDQDILFLLFSNGVVSIAAYHPSRHPWLPLSPPPGFTCGVNCVQISGGSLVMMKLLRNRLVVANLFSGVYAYLPQMMPVFHPYVLALIEETPSDYKIVAVSNADRIYSQVYDSRSGRWELRGQFAGRFAVLANAAYLDGLLFCLSRGPDHLLTFDPMGGEWSLVVETMPLSSLACPHILVFRGGVFLVSGVEEDGVIVRVGIWELDRSEKKWKAICFMPDEFFSEFGEGKLEYFGTVDRAGKICLHNWKLALNLMYDLSVRRWWWLPPCDVPMQRRFWLGHALEPHIDLVK